MNMFIRRIHLWLSVPLGLIVCIICLSGATMVFDSEITESLNPSIYKVERPEGAVPLQPSQIVEKVHRQLSDTVEVSSMEFSADPERACMLSIKGAEKKSLSVNQYTGEVNGWTESPQFFQTMRKLHRWLLDPPASKGATSVGKVIVGITTLVMVALLITGLVIWFPRTRKMLGNRLKVAFGKGTRRLIYDCHVTLGFYATIFLLLMALTGLTWSFGWYRSLFYDVFGASASSGTATASVSRPSGEKKEKDGQKEFDYSVWNSVLAQLKQEYSEYKSISLEAAQAKVSLPGNMPRTDTAKFNPESGKITGYSLYSQTPRSDKMKGWIYSFHTGSWGGIITKIIQFIAALIGFILPISGYYLWWKRTSRKRKKVAPRTAGK